MRGKHLLFLVSLYLGSSPIFANVLPCFDFVAALAEGGSLQLAHRVEWKPGKVAYFSNAELASIFSKGPTPEAIREGVKLLIHKRTFEIPVDERGIITASSAGTYSQALWLRDAGRKTFALPPNEKKRAVRMLLKLAGSPRNRELFFLNLRYKDLHRKSGEELRDFFIKNPHPLYEKLTSKGKLPSSSMFVPHIRFQLAEILDPRFFDPVESLKMDFRPQLWNHKQNDALAITFLAAADAMKRGVIKWTELDSDEQAAMILILAYGIHVEYHEKWDAGAWEENNGRRTSSVQQFTDALIEFEKYMLKSGKPIHLKSNPLIPSDIAEQIDRLIRPEEVRRAIEKGIQIVKHQIHRGEVPDAFEPGPMGPRYSDSALSHVAWTMPEYLDENDYRAVIRHLQNLRREKGMIRYERDVYLVLGQFWPSDAIVSKELLTPEYQNHPPKAAEVSEAFWKKQHDRIEAFFGKGFEAQWSLGELMLMQMLPQLLQRFPNSPYRQEYEDLLEEVVMKFFSMVTGEDAEGRGPVGLDGVRVPAWAIPEAWTVVRLYRPDGQVEVRYTPSPFTPLNWAKAEAWVGLEILYDYCQWDLAR